MEEKEKFLRSELWLFSWSAAVSHVKIFDDNVKPNDPRRKKFQNEIIEHCDENIIRYYEDKGKPVSEKEHCNKIDKLSTKAESTTIDSVNILHEGRFKTGSAQKLLNLQLKYMWCCELIPNPPPHCPIDRVVIELLRKKVKNLLGTDGEDARALADKVDLKHLTWSKDITDIGKYKDIITIIRYVAGNQPLAEWELENYERP